MGDFRIRVMNLADLDATLGWAKAEGWNPGVRDAESFHAADPEGFLVGVLDGMPIASISIVRCGPAFAFLGLYIVKPGFRGRGYGYALWNEAMTRMRGRNVGLDGVVAQQENYRKSGFTLAYRNMRFAGVSRHAATDTRIVPLATLPLDAILAYDRALFPGERSAFLRRWIAPAGGAALGLVEHDELVGYGVVRAAHIGHKIGPLFADTPGVADAIFDALAARAPAGSPLFLDVPEVNAAAVALAQRRGMAVSFETARMYTGTPPPIALNRVFGVTSFELG